MKKYFLLATFFVFSSWGSACETQLKNNTSNVISTLLGDNSEFSKAYKAGKCALDEALDSLPVSQRRVIANLIAKSYNFSKDNTKELLTYNY